MILIVTVRFELPLGKHRQTHTSISEQGNFILCSGIGPVFHFIGGNRSLTVMAVFILGAAAAQVAQGGPRYGRER